MLFFSSEVFILSLHNLVATSKSWTRANLINVKKKNLVLFNSEGLSIGPKGSSYSLHKGEIMYLKCWKCTEEDKESGWLLLLAGKKRWLVSSSSLCLLFATIFYYFIYILEFFPPTLESKLGPSFLQRSESVDTIEWILKELPSIKEDVRCDILLECIQNKGEVVFVPSGWLHAGDKNSMLLASSHTIAVLNLEDSLAVGENFMSEHVWKAWLVFANLI